ncbi:DUF475 domain-containing protein [Litoreibacter janthinus]|uniref:Integral membrane protein, YkoY family n=1 Tax=Litoreibacter janthinus TaxID=670154 RepID=A0A1I6GQF1_9RHOB|nr:DUF475 domain-containing protein [Litoreibacter janthinus]SFR44462.1 hypothetical protein SAMN04488002_1846 [Litoreibacter janthinus]
MSQTLKYFLWPFAFTALGLVLAYWLGYQMTGTVTGALSFFLIGCILAVLEISLSFDNAIVNANILKTMEPKWQHRFLTWGILIAVFGMRIIFPLAVVAIAAKIGPISAIVLAATDPQEYARIMEDSHIGISAFGGTFLMMVALTYFIDQSKEVDWIRMIERRLRSWASIRGLEIAAVLSAALILSILLPEVDGATFLFAAVCGLLTFLAVELVAHFLDAQKEAQTMAAKGGFGAFLYLEVLDASFSFDGVIGAFALTQNLFLIAIGLGIGAFYVRSMTIMLVERKTLSQFRYLEHGAFYSVLALSIIMYAQSLWHIPELVTGLIGAALISLSLISSIRHNKADQKA